MERKTSVWHFSWTHPLHLNKTSNLIFDITLCTKITHPTYWRTPLKLAAILISSTNDDSTLQLIYLRRRVRNRKKWTNQHCVIRKELGVCKLNVMKFQFEMHDYVCFSILRFLVRYEGWDMFLKLVNFKVSRK